THPLVLPPRALLSPDEQAVLTLAERHGKLTAKLVMTTQHVSKATATRRLAALTAVGLLLQRGKGRGTCYVPVTRFTEQRSQQPSPGVQEEASHRQPASMMAQALIATLQEQLQTLVPTLQQEHGVHALLLLPPWPNESQTARIAVHIAKGTTLTAFFQLEQWLRNTLAHPIDLIPVEQLQQYADADVIANGCWVTP
ncbi:MAG: hypothetical protein KDE53_04520, partial [Caldilineaceae bacterium]|nr:hypothetical protein [Caldilineaceae bacterium]